MGKSSTSTTPPHLTLRVYGVHPSNESTVFYLWAIHMQTNKTSELLTIVVASALAPVL